MRPSPVAALIGFALVAGGVFGGLLLLAACSENPSPNAACDSVNSSQASWWIAVLWPAGLFAASRFVALFRQHTTATAGAVAALGAVFWVVVFVLAG
jgi:hypothetical protein